MTSIIGTDAVGPGSARGVRFSAARRKLRHSNLLALNNGVWTFVAVDTDKPYVHDKQLLVTNTAEMREYRMRFWDKGEANGDWTPVQRVAIGT